MSEDEKLQRTQQDKRKMEAISQEAIAFLNAAAVGGSNESAFILYSFSVEWTPYWLKDRFSCSGAFFMRRVDKLSLPRYHTVCCCLGERSISILKRIHPRLFVALGSLVRQMYQQSEASKKCMLSAVCVHVFGEPVLEDGDKKLFRYQENKIKCCRGLIKATQNIITLLVRCYWIWMHMW